MFFIDFCLFIAILIAGHCSAWRTHDHTFRPDVVLRTSVTNLSIACTTRQSVIINGSVPAPELRIPEGKTTWIRVYNDIPDQNTTVHWHGLAQEVAPFSDGTPLVSQWPIPPLHYFDYEVAPLAGSAGTYFYHAHVGFQAVSAAGPLIVEEEKPATPPIAYDEERVLVVSELYYLKNDSNITAGLTSNNFTWSGEPDTFLVNGKSYAPVTLKNLTTPCAPAIIDVEPSKTYRFRAINANALGYVIYETEGHDQLEIVAADARYTKPINTSRIQFGPGQRYDYIIRTKSLDEIVKANKTDYWMQLEDRFRPSTPTSLAVLRYSVPPNTYCLPSTLPTYGTNATRPTKSPLDMTQDMTELTTWLEYQLEPLQPIPGDFPTASEVTRRVTIDTSQIYFPAGNVGWWSNNHSWSELSPNTSVSNLPYMIEIATKGDAAMPSYQTALEYGGWDSEHNVWVAEVGEVLEIVWQNEGNNKSGSFDSHIWHAHGAHYYDIGSGPGVYNATANEAKLANWNPPIRDSTMQFLYTLATGPPQQKNGWRAWRIRITDVGTWLIHCHQLQHMIMGMQTVWVMGTAEQIRAKLIPDEKYEAEIFNSYLTYGGEAYGNASWAPKVHHWHDGGDD